MLLYYMHKEINKNKKYKNIFLQSYVYLKFLDK